MQRINYKADGDGIVTLLKETADGFGRLMAAHVKLARLELLADIRTFSRRLTTLVAGISIAFLGYALVCMGLAVTLSRWIDLAGALFLVGGMNLVGAAVTLIVAVRRMRSTNPMSETAHEAGQSVATLTSSILHRQVLAVAVAENRTSGALVTSVRNQEGPH